MGGGKKQNQRTKGNVKPSSSSRAAEMLVQDGRTGFIGFGGLSETMGNAFGYVPKIAGAEDEGDQHDIDSELRMLMRKMGKKDKTTRLKAVQEFSQLCSMKEGDDVSKILSFWPRIYNKLSEDFDHRVREAIQLAHSEIVKKVGRKLAPQLKMMIASWLKSQFDQFAPAASVATKAFDVAFPGQKKTDALSFCKKDLLLNTQDLLIKQTKDTISDPRNVPEEEREAKYNRLISSTLFAMGYLMEMLPKDDLEILADLYHDIFKEKKFWKFGRHSSNMIRNAFFNAVSSACKFNATVLGNYAAVVCPTVLSCLDETDPTVVGSLWECVLHIVNTFEDCWNHINARKAVLPKLWSVLRKGGHGNAAVIFPNILPFFSKIPSSVIGDNLGFAREFFQSFREGLSTDKAMGSHSESVAVMDAYMECLRFELFSAQGSEGENQETDVTDEVGMPKVSDYLINEEIKHFIDATLEDKKYHWRKTFMKDFKELVRFLEKQTHSKLESDKKEKFHTRIINRIYKILEIATLDLLNHDGSSCELAMKRRFSNLEDLLKTVVLNVEMPIRKHKKQVLFTEKFPHSSDADTTAETANLMEQLQSDIDATETRLPVLSEWTVLLMKEISFKSLELLKGRRDVKYLEFLSTIICNVKEKSTFQDILSHMLKNDSEEIGEKNLFTLANKLIESVVQPVMTEDFTSKTSFWESNDCQTAIVDLVGRILSFLEKGQQLKLLKTITKICAKPFMFCLMVEKVLKLVMIDTLKLWFSESDIWPHLVNYVTIECSADSGYGETQKSSENLFACVELCLFYDKGLLCHDAYTEQLLVIFKNHLVSQEPHQNTFTSEKILTLVTEFYKNAMGNMPAFAIDLLLAIFHYNVKMQGNDAASAAEVALKYGIKSIQSLPNGESDQRLLDFLQKVACWIQMSRDYINDTNKLEALATSAGKLLQYLDTETSIEAENQHKNAFMLQLLSAAKRDDDMEAIAQRTCISNAVLCGVLNISNLSTENMESGVDMRRILNTANFAVMLISGLSDESISPDVSHNAILDSVKILCACSSETNEYQTLNEEFKNISTSVEMLVTGIKELLGRESFSCEKLLNVSLDRAIENGGLDVLSFDKLYSLMSKSILSELYINDLLGCAMSRDFSDRNSVDALKMILSHLDDLSITRAMVEQFVDKLGDISGENVQEFDSTLDLSTTALIRWQIMLQDGKEKSHDFADVIKTIMTQLIYWKDKSQDALLFSVDLSEAGDSQMALNVDAMKLLSFVVTAGAGYLNGVHWDFVLCSLASWIQTCEENVGNLASDSRAMVFAFWAFNLCKSVSEAFEQSIGAIDFSTSVITPSLKVRAPWFINEDWYSRNLHRISDEVVSEWQEFFTPAIYKGVYMLYKEFLSISMNEEKQASINQRTIPPLLNSVCSCLIGIPPTVLLDMLLDKETVEEQLQQGANQPTAGQEGSLDDDEIERLKNVVILLIEQFKSDKSCLQVVAFALLWKIMVVSPSTLTLMTTESVEGDECDTVRSLPDKLNEVLESTQEKLLAYTQEGSFTFGSYIIKPPSKELSATFLGYLLSWRITLRLFRGSEADQRAAYANYFRKRNMVGSLLKILFSLLPNDKGHLVSADPVLIEGDTLSLRELRQCAFHVYLSALECVPAVIRSWCNNNLDKKSASIIERFTTGYASPILCNREIEQVSSSSKTFTNMAIKTRPTAREVVALYTVEEISMELVVKMSQSHPLGPVVVECGKRVGVSSAQWRQWMLQLTMYLTQQNGTIVDGLSLWKRNVDKKFEGVEECMICFSVVHGTNYQLPTITCRVCKKKYHSACLYKWFSTSNKSTCPLCRNSF